MNSYTLSLLLCILSLLSSLVCASEAQEDEAELESVQIINGQVVIQLGEQVQINSEIKTQALNQIELETETVAYGVAITATPLLSTLDQYLSASAKQAGAKARLSKAEKTIARLRNLHKNKAISTQKLQTWQSEWQSAKAMYDEMLYKSKLITNKSKLQWGDVLTQWATGRHSLEFEKILEGKSTLIKLTLQAENIALKQISTISISPTGNREKAFSATFVSLLPVTDTLSQGLQYIFLTDSPEIKPGMNFTAWIPQQQTGLTGILVPKSALVWHLGQSFIFIKIDDEHFIHQNIINPISVPGGYFITEHLDSEDRDVVVKGAQTLLSHEFRSQIPDEDD